MPITKKQTKRTLKKVGTKKTSIPKLKKGAKKVNTKRTKKLSSSSKSGAKGVVVKTKLGHNKHIVKFKGGCGCGGAV